MNQFFKNDLFLIILLFTVVFLLAQLNQAPLFPSYLDMKQYL